jgi:tetratricopeptide (TPR) repeat protein
MAASSAAGDHLLGMLVDRTSFDETDDYGIDRVAIVDSIPTNKLNNPNSTVLKSGRVRRRLRWRPKRRHEAAATVPAAVPEDDSSQEGGGLRSVSSNVSVSSQGNQSCSSRASRRSTHSFSSTATMKLDNTEQADTKVRAFPLPRPKYPSSFDGVSTIGTEATMVHARISKKKGRRDAAAVVAAAATDDGKVSPSTVFAAADLDEAAKLPPASDNTQKKRGFPPLFRRTKPPVVPRGKPPRDPHTVATPPMSPRQADEDELEEIHPFLRSSASTPLPLPPPADLRKTRSAHAGLALGSVNSPPTADEDLPTVPADPLDTVRRVDLRIPQQRETALVETQAVLPGPVLSYPEGPRPGGGHAIQWSRSESAMTTMSHSCVDFLIAADPVAMGGDAAATDVPEIRFSMSDVASHHKFDEPTPSAPPSAPTEQPPDHLPAPPSFSLEPKTSEAPPLVPPQPPVSQMPSPPPPVEDQDISATTSAATEGTSSSSASRTSVPVSVDDGTFLDVEKNLQAIHDMGIEHLRHNEFSEALEVFEEILRGQLTRYGEEHYRVGTALHNIGIVHMKEGDYEEAARVSLEAVRIRRLTLPANHPDVAVSLAQLGVALLECRKFKKSISHFREALRIRRRCYGPKHLKVAKLLNNIGCALYELNELEVAEVAFEEALDIQRSTLREVPVQDLEEPTNQILLSIASTLSNIGSIKLYWGQNGEASIDLEEALLIQQSVLGDDHPFAKRTEECLEWMESKGVGMDAIGEADEENSVAASSNSKEGKNLGMCSSTAISEDKTGQDLQHVIDIFNRNLWSLKSGFDMTCQGKEPLIYQESGVAQEPSADIDV